MNIKLTITCLLFIIVVGCRKARTQISLVDKEATEETKALYKNLKKLCSETIIFGHQNATMYGIGWEDKENYSDIKAVTGSHPALYGWDFLSIMIQKEDSEKFKKIAKLVKEAYNRGGINTFSWHIYNPITLNNFYDTTRAIYSILPNGEKHELYKQTLDKIANFAKNLRGQRGELIPIIFRPYHEHNGNWFWWGKRHCTTEEFVALWRFTVEYLRDVKQVHNFIYAYSPNGFKNKKEYLERYPGDEYVDIIGHDNYGGFYDENKVARKGINNLEMIVEIAEEKDKIAALTETGHEKITIDDWFTKVLLDPIKNNSVAKNISYIMVWRNAHTEHFYAPYPNHSSAEDFIKFRENSFTMFENDLPNMYE